MGCQSAVVIGDNLTFSITTHDPDTGVLTDADAAPDYRVYEDETAVAILNGTMAKLDDANTTGFYTELIACTLGNGFEDGKSYNIYIEATVDGDQGGISFGFRAFTALSNMLTVDTIAEMAQQIPPTTPTIEEALMYLYMSLTKKVDSDATLEFHNDAGTVIWKQAQTDDGATFSKAKGASGP